MRREIAKGAAWMILMRLSDRLLGLASTLVLARLLVPADFGLVAMAMSFIALIELAGAFSFEIVLIQRADPTRAHFDTAWTLNFAFALLCAALTAGLAPMAATFYGDPRLTLLMFVLAAGWALQGLENIGIVNFRRRLDFSREFRFMFGKRIVGFVVTLVLAYAWRSYWALIAGQLANRIAGVLLSYLMEPHRPRLTLAARADLFSFSGWMLVTNILGFCLARLSHFLVGRVEGPAALGMYTTAAEFARLPSTELSAPINRAVLPGLARLTHDRPAMRHILGEVIGTTFALTLPASIGLAMISGLLVQVVLGSKWLDAAPLLCVLAISGAVEVIAANSSVAYLALGEAKLIAGLNAAKLVVLVALAGVLVPSMGAIGMALAELAASSFVVVVSTAVLLRYMTMPAVDLLAVTWRIVVATAVMTAGLFWMLGPPFGSSKVHPPWMLAASIFSGAALYIASLFGLWWLSGRPPGAEASVLNRATAILRVMSPRLFPSR